MMEWTQNLPFSRSYLTIVIAVALVVGGLAVFGQSSTLALAAAILGLYVLHLFSNWQLASNQRQQWQTLREVERMLGALDGEQTASAGEETGTTFSPGEAKEGEGDLSAVGEEPDETRTETTSDGDTSAGDGSAETAASDVPAGGDPTAGQEDRGRTDGEIGETEENEEDEDTVLVPRQYKLGTVAVVERVLTPAEVARVLTVQDRHSDRQFGDIAVDLDLLTDQELEELLEIQQRGLYRPEAISRARRDLKQFQRQKAAELGTGP